jgi:hypothetical protein
MLRDKTPPMTQLIGETKGTEILNSVLAIYPELLTVTSVEDVLREAEWRSRDISLQRNQLSMDLALLS